MNGVLEVHMGTSDRAWYEKACMAVKAIEDQQVPYPNLTDSERENVLRCHEVARAVAIIIGLPGPPETTVVDGMYGAVEHTWIELRDGSYGAIILDVYSPGRFPQVQLLDLHPNLPHSRLYRAGKPCTHVRQNVIDRLVAAAAVSEVA